jgi:hypothetical protein
MLLQAYYQTSQLSIKNYDIVIINRNLLIIIGMYIIPQASTEEAVEILANALTKTDIQSQAIFEGDLNWTNLTARPVQCYPC